MVTSPPDAHARVGVSPLKTGLDVLNGFDEIAESVVMSLL